MFRRTTVAGHFTKAASGTRLDGERTLIEPPAMILWPPVVHFLDESLPGSGDVIAHLDPVLDDEPGVRDVLHLG